MPASLHSRPAAPGRQRRSLLLKAILTSLVPALYGTTIQAQEASEIDWVSWENLTPEQQAAAPDLCCGMYVEPPIGSFPPLASPLPPEDAAEIVQLEASRRIDYQDEAGIVELQGDVRARQGDATLFGDRGRYDRNAQTMSLEGNVRVREPGMLLVGESGFMDNQAGTMRLEGASYVLHEQSFRGTADVIVYTDDQGIVTIDNGLYSRCEPGTNTWAVQAREIVLNQESGRGTARHATLRIRGIPVLYTPYASFPINDERVSGFLAPSIGSTDDGGLDLSLPYYFNLAPNYDATYTPRYMADRGLHHGLEFRHLGDNTNNVLNLGYLGKDKRYDEAALARREQAIAEGNTDLLQSLDSPPVEKRWYMDADHRGSFGERWSTGMDYSAVSDERYLQDFSSEGVQVSAQSYLRRTGQLRYNGDVWRMTTRLQSFQMVDPDINELSKPLSLLPQITLEGRYNTDFNLEYGLETEYSYFDRRVDEDDFTQGQIDRGLLVSGGRLTAVPTLSYDWSTPGIFVRPTLEYYYSNYHLQDAATDNSDTPTRGVLSGHLDTGLIFERPLQLFGGDFTQTLEPRLFYLYTDYEDQSELPNFDSSAYTFSFSQMFRSNSFSGNDRISDANQLSVALSSRFLDSAGREKASISVGQILYFADRRVTLNNRITEEQTRDTSNIATQLSYRFSDNWRISSYLEWNSTDNTFDVGSFQFQYQSDINHILNFGLRFRDDGQGETAEGFDRRIIQSNASFAWPINAQWGIVGNVNYDHANDRSLETLAGFEYSSCCWNARLVYREWIDRFDQQRSLSPENDYGLFLQFELKGLGSIIGGSVGNILANSIYGYRQQ